MAPNWLDFAALVKGHQPLRREGEPFRYLELGSGMGLHLCLLAAAYPEGTFVGGVLHADQIAHSRQLTEQLGLSNVHLLQADLVHLAQQGCTGAETLSLDASCTDEVSHGLYSLVAPEVQAALIKVAARALAIGGIFCCSSLVLPDQLRGEAGAFTNPAPGASWFTNENSEAASGSCGEPYAMEYEKSW